MAELREVVAARIAGKPVTLEALLYTMKITDRMNAFQQAIEDLVIQQAAGREGISVSDSELQAESDSLRIALRLQDAKAAHSWLEKRGMSADDWEKYLERVVAARRLKSKLTDDKVEAYFVEHRPAFDAARIARLSIPSEGAARDIVARLKEQKVKFEELAAQYPADPQGAPADGSGYSLRMHMDPKIAAAVFNATGGQIVGPVATDRGSTEVIRVDHVRRAQLDEHTAAAVRDILFGISLRGEVEKARVEFFLPQLAKAS